MVNKPSLPPRKILLEGEHCFDVQMCIDFYPEVTGNNEKQKACSKLEFTNCQLYSKYATFITGLMSDLILLLLHA